MLPVAIFRHVEHEGPGYLLDFMQRHDIAHELVCIDAGDAVPGNALDYSGLVFMGGPMSVNDPLPWITDEIQLIRRAIAADRPVLGHCLGGQLIARALGARVDANPVTEIGWHRVWQCDNEASRACLHGLAPDFMVYHWHSETFELPSQAQPLLHNKFCANQGFVSGKTLALQCHIEMTADMVREWTRRGEDRLQPSESIQSATEMNRDLQDRVTRLNHIADIIYSYWSRGLTR